MSHNKTLVCFARSRKNGGCCIAGKEWLGGQPGSWVRPVNILTGGATMHGVSVLDALDIFDVPLGAPVPQGHQTENYRLAARAHWIHRGRLPWGDVSQWLDTPAPLWQNGCHSCCGHNDRVPPGTATSSLRLIQVERCDVVITRDHKLRARFNYLGDDYDLALTDLWFDGLQQHQPATHTLREVTMCISLGEVFNGYCYKLVAALLFPRRFQ